MVLSHTGITEKVLTYKAPHQLVKESEPAKDRASFADPEKKSLLSAATKVRHLTPYIGTELVGVQLNKLTPEQKDELALLAAERCVVFFRDQEITVDEQYELTKHYGISQWLQPLCCDPRELLNVYVQQDRDPNQVDPRHVTIIGRDYNIREYASYGADFHADHSFELNPPAYTMLNMLRTPEFGGDTIFTSGVALYDKLSPRFQALFDGMHAIHSSEHAYINTLNNGGEPFRGPVRREHPLVRTHPVTRLKTLFYNPSFVEHLSELNGQEAIHAMSFLREHLHAADDLTVRWKWEPGSIAFWDNRVTIHKAIPGAYDITQREGKRTAIFGERPFFDPQSESLSQYKARKGTAPAMNGVVKKEAENL